MDGLYLDKVKKIAYFLWEYTEYDDALKHWYCAEDIGCYLEEHGFLNEDSIEKITKKDKDDYEYIQFVRNIAFRIYVYTNRSDELSNWLDAEKLLSNGEWCKAALFLANYYSRRAENSTFIDSVKSDKVRNYYNHNSRQ